MKREQLWSAGLILSHWRKASKKMPPELKDRYRGIFRMLSCCVAMAAIFMTVAANSSTAVDVEIQATLSPPVIPFHRVAYYTISVEAPEDLEIKPPPFPDQIEGLEIRTAPPERSVVPGGRVRSVYRYTLDPIHIKTHHLPPPEVHWEGGVLAIPGLTLEVRDLSPAELEAAAHFEEIVPVGAVTPQRWNRSHLLAASLALVIMALLALFLWRRHHRIGAVLPPPPPWEVARQRLRELNRRQLPAAGKYEAYYVDLSAILRYYIEDRFTLHAPEQTTPEFLEEAAQTGLFSEAQQQRVSAFLRHCDYVKFAQYRPSTEEMERGYQFVHWFIDDTIPHTPEQTSGPKHNGPAPDYIEEPVTEDSQREEAVS
jgi:hypothetical protein